MIYLEMSGRLGNQMFRYAFAKKLQKLTNKELIIDFSRVYSSGSIEQGWNNSLKLFKTDNYKEVNGEKKKYFYKNATFMQIFLHHSFRFISRLLYGNKERLKKFQMFFQPILNRYNMFFLELGYYDYDFSYLDKTKVIYVYGCFECSKYFNEIEEDLKKDFTPIKSLNPKNNELYNKIIDSNSICVTVRRGDFVTNETYKKLYDICNIDYYNKAVRKIKEIIDNPVFFVFSDDVEWAKNNIDFQDCEVYSEDGNDSLDEKIRLMSSCKHFIISNSTFSWWAQYLGDYNNKIVISPSKWYKNNMESDLIEDDWIKIDVE